MSLAWDVMRYRRDQRRLVDSLNEVPFVFGHDQESLRLLRAVTGASSDAQSEKP